MADVARILQVAADKMFKTFEQKKVAIVLTNITEYEYDPLDQSVTNTDEVKNVTAIKTHFGDKEVDGIKILQSDIKFLVMNRDIIDFDLTTETSLTVGTKVYNVVKATEKGISTYTVIQARAV